MKREELEKLIEVRKYVIDCHNSLDPNGGAHSVVEQEDVAFDFTHIISKLDEVLRPHVNFE